MPFLNRALVATTTVGTGTITLGSAFAGHRTFAAAGAVDGGAYPYAIEDGTNFEVGVGVYTASSNTLTRTLRASSTGALLNLSGNASVFSTMLAEDIDLLALKASPIFSGRVGVPAVTRSITALGTVSSGTATFDVTTTSLATLTNGGAHSWAFNWGANEGEIEIFCQNAGSAAITMPTINWCVGDGTYSTTFSSQGVTLQATGPAHFWIWTFDGGATLYGIAR